MTNDTQDFNIGKIRELLQAAFTAEELERFCEDRPIFSPVGIRFGRNMGLDDMVDEVIDYCRTQLLLKELLEQVAGANWRQYAQFQPALGSSAPPIPSQPVTEIRAAAPPTPAQRKRRLVYWIVGGGLLLVITGLAIAGLAMGLLSKPTPKNSFQIVFDRSEAMDEAFDNQDIKLEMAKGVIPEVLSRWVDDDDDNLALRLFGGTCFLSDDETTELVVPFGRNNREPVAQQLLGVTTQGEGTLVAAIKAATRDFDDLERSEGAVNRIIVITGSDKFCVKEYANDIQRHLEDRPEIKIDFQFIGLGLSADQQAGLQALAQVTGGKFYPASDLAELEDALTSAFKPPTPTPTNTHTPTPTSSLTPTVTGTHTPTPTNSPTPTDTPQPPMPTDTPVPPAPTNTPEPPAPTNTPVPPTPTNSPTPTVTGTHSPVPTNTPTTTFTSTPTPTPYPAPTLLLPHPEETLAGLFCFRWQGGGKPLPENLAFDLRIWWEKEPRSEARGVDKLIRMEELCVDLQFVPAIQDHGGGYYSWTVLVVEKDTDGPKVVGAWGESRQLKYKP